MGFGRLLGLGCSRFALQEKRTARCPGLVQSVQAGALGATAHSLVHSDSLCLWYGSMQQSVNRDTS